MTRCRLWHGLALGVLWGVAACGGSSGGESPEHGPANEPAGGGPATLAEAPAASDERSAFAGPVIVFMEATPAEIEARRSTYDEEQDYYTMTDDLMWYRSQAHEFLDSLSFAEVIVRERGPLTLAVDGRLQRYDFDEFTFLDLIVAYRPATAPLVVAPVDVHRIADYFAEPK
ncbi:MAG TPA: hypothetical protein VMM18_17115 [Gemmatimonadaceae bacterium]|nr:hypothetical protein [Gemmatimonadaceae bacterium]